MVYNCFIKCRVCGSITRIRLQVGWQKEHPIVVTCGKCTTSLSGSVEIGQDQPKLEFDFDNVEIVTDVSNFDYVVECSGEFPTLKQCKKIPSEYILPTPFMRTIHCMKNDDSYEMFRENVGRLYETSAKWNDYKRILNLFRNNSEYLEQEIKKEFKGYYFQCRNELETLRAVHMIEVVGFYSPLKRELLNDLSFSGDILKLDIIQMKKMIDYLNAHEGYHLDEMQNLIYKIYDEFVDIYDALIPALVLQYCKDDAFNLNLEGSTTSTFDMVKQFYLDVYEALGTLLIIPVALNNIKYRLDVNQLVAIKQNAVSLDDFIKLTKATRYHYCLHEEVYTDFLDVIANSKLRNAIGHNDVEYDTVSQLITYIPNPKDRRKKKYEYLLEFENQTIHMFQAILTISEYLYRIRELELMFKGNVPILEQNLMARTEKIGRNAPCPCGSGNKYKRCCGKK